MSKMLNDAFKYRKNAPQGLVNWCPSPSILHLLINCSSWSKIGCVTDQCINVIICFYPPYSLIKTPFEVTTLLPVGKRTSLQATWHASSLLFVCLPRLSPLLLLILFMPLKPHPRNWGSSDPVGGNATPQDSVCHLQFGNAVKHSQI